MPSPHCSHVIRSPLYPGNSSGGKFDLYPLGREEIIVGHFAIGEHLLLVLVFDFRMHLSARVPWTILSPRCGSPFLR